MRGSSSTRSTAVFAITASVVAVILCAKIVPLRLLFMDARVRAQVQTTMQDIAARKGWLLSDLLLQDVTSVSLTVLHREHRRGADPTECFVVPFTHSDLQSCE